jgi:hypothetical protein
MLTRYELCAVPHPVIPPPVAHRMYHGYGSRLSCHITTEATNKSVITPTGEKVLSIANGSFELVAANRRESVSVLDRSLRLSL